jgi:hypothetical protein
MESVAGSPTVKNRSLTSSAIMAAKITMARSQMIQAIVRAAGWRRNPSDSGEAP